MEKARIIQLPKNGDRRGNLSVIEQLDRIPFKIERAFWIYDVPGGAARGGHAYRESEEFIVALSGSFDVVIDDGKEKQVFSLNQPVLLRTVCPEDDVARDGQFLHQFRSFGAFVHAV